MLFLGIVTAWRLETNGNVLLRLESRNVTSESSIPIWMITSLEVSTAKTLGRTTQAEGRVPASIASSTLNGTFGTTGPAHPKDQSRALCIDDWSINGLVERIRLRRKPRQRIDRTLAPSASDGTSQVARQSYPVSRSSCSSATSLGFIAPTSRARPAADPTHGYIDRYEPALGKKQFLDRKRHPTRD